jgi:branched-chain amino acid transport system substrate-binding protein
MMKSIMKSEYSYRMVYSGPDKHTKAVSCSVVQKQVNKNTSIFNLLVFLLFMPFLTFYSIAQPFKSPSENNYNKQPIFLASSSALSGPTAKLGTRLNQGSQAYFDKINSSGGIYGRQILLDIVDDGYEPFKTLKNTQAFLTNNKVFALFNYVGTPTTSVVFPLIRNKQLPFLMPFTGATFLRKPVTENVFNLRASYYQEIDKQLHYLINKEKITRIGLLIQADAFGITAEKSYRNIMKKYDIEPVVTTRYRRNTEDIELALSILKNKNIEAVAFVGTYEPFAELINTAAAQQFTPFFTSVSFISSHDLFSKITQKSRVLITEVVPEPQTCSLNVCQQFINDMREAGKGYTDQVQFEGYLNAYLFVEVAKQCGENLTQSCFLNKMKNFNYDFGGITVSFSPDNHQGLNNVYLNFFEMQK